MEKTAVDWLCRQIYTIQVELEAGNNHLKMKIKQAKEMEKHQFINFHIEVMKKGLEYENEQEWVDEYLPLIKKRAELYYNEKFK